ncbi:MAG: TatD family hydrolase [Candidatus Dormibacteria bacterium]
MTGGPLVDTHCHLVLIEERGYLDEAVEAAVEAGVEQIVSVGLNLEDSERNQQIADRLPGVFFSVGWHPHEKAPPDGPQLAALDELLGHPRAVAVGEVGLDRYWRPGYHETPLSVQRRSLQAMLELAEGRDKPVIIHDRDAHAETLDELGARPALRPLMHCFSGDATHAARCLALGHVLSFAGTVTFRGSDGVRDAARGVAADRYVVETDAPFLAPHPHRGKPNHPAYVADTAGAIAAIRSVPIETVRAESSATARGFFALPAGDRLGGGTA